MRITLGFVDAVPLGELLVVETVIERDHVQRVAFLDRVELRTRIGLRRAGAGRAGWCRRRRLGWLSGGAADACGRAVRYRRRTTRPCSQQPAINAKHRNTARAAYGQCPGSTQPRQHGHELDGVEPAPPIKPRAPRSITHRCCSRVPIGTTIRPPGASCSFSASGTCVAAAVTKIASNGAAFGQCRHGRRHA